VFSPRSALTTATALAMTGLLLAGCSAAANPQSTTQACEVLANDLSSSASQLTSAFSEIQTDPKAAETALAKFGATLKKSSAKVTNAKIKAAAGATSAALDSMDTDLKTYIKDSTKTAALASSGAKVQNTVTKLGSLCTA
jgi:hypothetical protein